jgi:hypothetical protein
VRDETRTHDVTNKGGEVGRHLSILGQRGGAGSGAANSCVSRHRLFVLFRV